MASVEGPRSHVCGRGPFLCTPYLGFCSQKCDKSVFFPAVRASGSPAALVDGPRRALYLRAGRPAPASRRKKDRLIANLDRFPQAGEALICRGASPPRRASRAPPRPLLPRPRWGQSRARASSAGRMRDGSLRDANWSCPRGEHPPTPSGWAIGSPPPLLLLSPLTTFLNS